MAAVAPLRAKARNGPVAAAGHGRSVVVLLLLFPLHGLPPVRGLATVGGTDADDGGIATVGGKDRGGNESTNSSNLNAPDAICDALADPKAVDELLRRGADLEAKVCSWSGAPPLAEAARSGFAETVQLLLDRGANINGTDRAGFTILMSAAIGGHTSTTGLLLDHGTNIDAKNPDGFTALFVAAYAGHASIVKMLRHSGADTSASAARGAVGLMWYASNGPSSIVGLLLDCGVSVRTTNAKGQTALMKAAKHGKDDIVKLLVGRRADVNFGSKQGFTALIAAAHGGYPSTVKLLIDLGADVRGVTKSGVTALSEAAHRGHVPAAKVLLDRGASVNVATHGGYTPLIVAALGGSVSMLKVLLDHGADLDSITHFGLSALMAAAFHGHDKAVKLLLDRGANIRHTTHSGRTALMLAAQAGHATIVKLLLERGADLHRADHIHGFTALILAVRGGHKLAAEVILFGGANFSGAGEEDFEAIDELGRTALHHAAVRGMLQMTEELVQKDPKTRFMKDYFLQTPRDLAVNYSHYEVLPALPPETAEEAWQRLLQNPKTLFVVPLCIFACLLAVSGLGRSSKKNGGSGASRGATLLAGRASVAWSQESFLTAFRIVDIFAATVVLAKCMQSIKLTVSLSIIVLFYVAPKMVLGAPAATFDLAVWLSAVPVTLLAKKAWRWREVAACAIGTTRLIILAILLILIYQPGLGQDVLNERMLMGADAIFRNKKTGIVVPVPPFVDALRGSAWQAVDGTCREDEDGCITSEAHYPSCRVGAPQYGLTSVISMVANGTEAVCDASIYVIGDRVHAIGAQGLVPRGDFIVDALHGCRICPLPGEVAILTPTVAELWWHWRELCLAVCLLALLGSAGMVSKKVFSQRARESLSVRSPRNDEDMLTEDEVCGCEGLAMQIEDIANEDREAKETRAALQTLTGAGRAVQPVTPWVVRCAVAMVVLEVWLQLCCVLLFVASEDVFCAGFLMAALLYAAATQLHECRSRSLRAEVAETIRSGRWTDRLLEASERHRGGPATLALLATSVGLPLAARTPLQAMLGMLSILVGCYGIGNHLFCKVDIEGGFGGQRPAGEGSGDESEDQPEETTLTSTTEGKSLSLSTEATRTLIAEGKV